MRTNRRHICVTAICLKWGKQLWWRTGARYLSNTFRGHSGYSLNHIELTLHCNVVSYWLSPCPQLSMDSSRGTLCYIWMQIMFTLYPVLRGHSGYSLNHIELTLHCNVVSYWLSPCPQLPMDSGRGTLCYLWTSNNISGQGWMQHSLVG